jgi:hypothetical protein
MIVPSESRIDKPNVSNFWIFFVVRMNQRIRPWFAQTVYDSAENLRRRKQLLPVNKRLKSFRLSDPLEIINLSSKSFDSWSRLFPRKIPQWESRLDPAESVVEKQISFSRSVRIERGPQRPELVIKKPTFTVPDKLSSEFKSNNPS